MLGASGHRVASVVGFARDEHARLLPSVRDVERGEVLAQHVVHAEAHVLETSAREHHNVRLRVGGDQARDVAQRLERARQSQQHDAGAAYELGIEGH